MKRKKNFETIEKDGDVIIKRKVSPDHQQIIIEKSNPNVTIKKEKKGRDQLFGEWLLNVSEPPVIYDSFLMQKSAKQIKLLLNKQ